VVPLTSAAYNGATNTVTLALKGKVPKQAMRLTIIAADLRDAEGRDLDGKGNGEPGCIFVGALNSHEVISMSRTMVEARIGRVAAAAIDAMMADGTLPMGTRGGHRHRPGTP
jgi:hypothetical protein